MWSRLLSPNQVFVRTIDDDSQSEVTSFKVLPEGQALKLLLQKEPVKIKACSCSVMSSHSDISCVKGTTDSATLISHSLTGFQMIEKQLTWLAGAGEVASFTTLSDVCAGAIVATRSTMAGVELLAKDSSVAVLALAEEGALKVRNGRISEKCKFNSNENHIF